MPDRISTNNGGGLDIEGEGRLNIRVPVMQLGDAATDTIALFGSTPVVQPATTGEATGFVAVGGTAVQHQSTFTGNVGSKAYTLNDIVKHLKNLGIIASS